MILIYTLLAVVVVSLISFVGVLTLSWKRDFLEKFLLYLVGFSIGALLGDVFVHIIPYIVEERGFDLQIASYFLGGILLFFIVEKFVHWHGCHKLAHEHKIKPMAYTNLIGDGLHNFLDGVVIAASFMVSVPLGVATTVAVLFHEIPQEIGDFGILIYAGFSKSKALLFNFLSALTAVIGAILTLMVLKNVQGLELVLLAIVGGGFIYISGSDLIPELHKHSCSKSKSVWQFVAIALGIAVMYLILFLE